MELNRSKCQQLTVSNKQKLTVTSYTIHGQQLVNIHSQIFGSHTGLQAILQQPCGLQCQEGQLLHLSGQLHKGAQLSPTPTPLQHHSVCQLILSQHHKGLELSGYRVLLKSRQCILHVKDVVWRPAMTSYGPLKTCAQITQCDHSKVEYSTARWRII